MTTPTRVRKVRPWFAGALCAVLAATGVAIATTASAAPVNISQGKLATSSSAEGPDFTASKAVDGNNNTRWASQFADPQWLQVDLGATATITQVELQLGGRLRARPSRSRLSADGTTWTTVYHDHHRHRRHPDARASPAPAATCGMYGTAARHRLRLLAVGVQGLRRSAPRPTGGPGSVHGQPAGAAVPRRVPPTPTRRRPPRVPGELLGEPHNLPDDPIVFPGLAGRLAQHTFMGNTHHQREHHAGVAAGRRHHAASRPSDKSAYWMPTLMRNGNTAVAAGRTAGHLLQDRRHRLHAASGPFPQGLRFVVGSPTATQDEFRNAPGAVEGFECGNSSFNWDIPATCPAGHPAQRPVPGAELLGRHAPGHARPQEPHGLPGQSASARPTHPVAVPMIEFKMAWPVSGNMSHVRLLQRSGLLVPLRLLQRLGRADPGRADHHCINGGLQCDPRGFDLYKPWAGAVLDASYELIP